MKHRFLIPAFGAYLSFFLLTQEAISSENFFDYDPCSSYWERKKSGEKRHRNLRKYKDEQNESWERGNEEKKKEKEAIAQIELELDKKAEILTVEGEIEKHRGKKRKEPRKKPLECNRYKFKIDSPHSRPNLSPSML